MIGRDDVPASGGQLVEPIGEVLATTGEAVQQQ